MATLAVVVNGRGNLETILPAASTLAKRHVDYGVRAADYTCVGDASVDARTRPWRPMDPATRRHLERGLRDHVRLHDRRGPRPRHRGRMSGRCERASKENRRLIRFFRRGSGLPASRLAGVPAIGIGRGRHCHN